MEDTTKENFIKEIKALGFINGQINFGGFKYKVRLLTNEEFEVYEKKVSIDPTSALDYIFSVTVYREQKRWWTRKPKQIFDFNIKKYPTALTDIFVRDLFKIILDKDFFRYLIERGDSIEK